MIQGVMEAYSCKLFVEFLRFCVLAAEFQCCYCSEKSFFFVFSVVNLVR